MSAGTKIQWSDDTHNFWRGCTKVSAGCAHCYAESNVGVRMAGVKWGNGAPRLKSKSFFEPLKWNKRPWVCESCGRCDDRHYDHSCTGRPEDARHTCDVQWHRRRVFSLSLGDWLDDEVPLHWLAEMLRVIHETPNLDWLLLTKRPENWATRVSQAMMSIPGNNDYVDETICMVGKWGSGKPPENVWIGVSVENQEAADKRIPELLKIPARIRFLSVEPMLGPIDLEEWILPTVQDVQAIYADQPGSYPRIHWAIFGGESSQPGRPARNCNIDWIANGLRQCRAAGVAAFVKQLGSVPVTENANQYDFPDDADLITGPGSFAASAFLKLRDKKGGDPSEWPDQLRVRQFPSLKSEVSAGHQNLRPGRVALPKMKIT